MYGVVRTLQSKGKVMFPPWPWRPHGLVARDLSIGSNMIRVKGKHSRTVKTQIEKKSVSKLYLVRHQVAVGKQVHSSRP